MSSSVKLGDDVAKIMGPLPAPGKTAPDFRLVAVDLGERSLSDYADTPKVLNIFPSIDTPTCATAARTFNERATALAGAPVLCISKDLPFAAKRYCEGEGIKKVEFLSAYLDADFGRDYGVGIVDGPLRGLFARAVLVLDGDNKIVHSELVANIKDEPDYRAAFDALDKI